MDLICYGCASENLRLVYSLNGFSLFTCRACNFAKIYPTPDASSLSKYYSGADSSIAKGNALNEIQAFLDNPEQTIRIIRDIRLRPLESFGEVFHDKHSVIVDVGCGGGAFLAALKYLGYENIFGLEFNAASVAMIRERLGIQVLESDIAFSPDIPKAHIITSFDVLEHVPNPQEALRQINRMTMIGGGFHLRVPNYGSLLSKVLGARWLWALPPYHLNYFTPEVLAKMVSASGFTIERIWTSGSGYRLAFLLLQGRKLLKNTVEIPAAKTTAYSALTFDIINLAECATKILLFPYSALAGRLKLDDCINIIARKQREL